MGKKTHPQKRIYGWMPKAPSFPNSQKTEIVSLNREPKRLAKTKALTLFFIVTFSIVLGTLSILGVLRLGAFASFAAGALAVLITIVWSLLLLKTCNQNSKLVQS